MKPDNILFTNSTLKRVKIIDFGASCTHYSQGFTYVQSRYYRCPEITLGLKYSHPADMWSLGCIVTEMATGRFLFPAKDET
mmetsp:Transcript_24704/g.17403  ORF Transcript_24704/g.17403 Transcript_24704/m.17403 type:complete len:81 (-) Transcript_24704:261-503(-)